MALPLCADLTLMMILSVVCQAEDGTVVDLRVDQPLVQTQPGLHYLVLQALVPVQAQQLLQKALAVLQQQQQTQARIRMRSSENPIVMRSSSRPVQFVSR
jgi:hypothetical protein